MAATLVRKRDSVLFDPRHISHVCNTLSVYALNLR